MAPVVSSPCGAGAGHSLEQRIVGRLGLVPALFQAPVSWPVRADLWRQAEFAWLDNPLPVRFREKLIVQLSRDGQSPYCLGRHIGYLCGLGTVSTDPHWQPLTPSQVLEWLQQPLPGWAGIRNRLADESGQTGGPAGGDALSHRETELLACCGMLFGTGDFGPLPPEGPDPETECRQVVQRILGEELHDHLMSLIGFVRAVHDWTRSNPRIAWEADVEDLFLRYPDLGQAALSERSAGFPGRWSFRTGPPEAGREQGEGKVFPDESERRDGGATEQERLAIEADALALEESEERFAAAFHGSPQPLCIMSHDSRFMEVNQAFCDMVDYPASALLGRTSLEIGLLCSKAEFDSLLAMVHSRNGHVPNTEFQIRTRSGEIRDSMFCTRPVFLNNQPHRLAALIDITSQKSAFRALKRSEDDSRKLNAYLERRVAERTRDLQIANDDLNAYAHSVAHDLRAPLRALFGFARALREDYADRLDDIAREYTGHIESAAHQMDDLIGDLLEYSKVGRHRLSRGPVDLDDAVERALEQHQADLQDSAARVRICRPLGVVSGHRNTLVQVIGNLLANALKFVEAGTVPSIVIRSEQSEVRTRLWVEDNGVGIDPAFHEQIFQVFERLHGVESFSGTGIGLAIVRRGMESLGGRAGVESEQGKGSRFWLELPGETELNRE